MKCEECGVEVRLQANFCQECGSSLGQPEIKVESNSSNEEEEEEEVTMSNWIQIDIQSTDDDLFCPACGKNIGWAWANDIEVCQHVMAIEVTQHGTVETYYLGLIKLSHVNPRYQGIVDEIEEQYWNLAEEHGQKRVSTFDWFAEKTSSPSTMFMSVSSWWRGGFGPHGPLGSTFSVGIDFEPDA